MDLTDEVEVKLLTAAYPSYVYDDFLIGYNLNDFSFTVELTTDKKEQMEITLETRYHSPTTESAEDSLTIKITETIYN
ncbi:MAG: hypothetical protein FK734_00875, partial [Asgard group archaeon]|nr:hypothetical protein [Asgard group archaeon]